MVRAATDLELQGLTCDRFFASRYRISAERAGGGAEVEEMPERFRLRGSTDDENGPCHKAKIPLDVGLIGLA